MLGVLFDKNVPYPLKRYLADCAVKTVEEEGWGQISNGELISCAGALRGIDHVGPERPLSAEPDAP